MATRSSSKHALFPSLFELCYLPLVQAKSFRAEAQQSWQGGLDQSQQDTHQQQDEQEGMVLVIVYL